PAAHRRGQQPETLRADPQGVARQRRQQVDVGQPEEAGDADDQHNLEQGALAPAVAEANRQLIAPDPKRLRRPRWAVADLGQLAQSSSATRPLTMTAVVWVTSIERRRSQVSAMAPPIGPMLIIATA